MEFKFVRADSTISLTLEYNEFPVYTTTLDVQTFNNDLIALKNRITTESDEDFVANYGNYIFGYDSNRVAFTIEHDNSKVMVPLEDVDNMDTVVEFLDSLN